MSLFSWFMGNESERGTNKSREPRSGSRGNLFVLRSDSITMNQEKKTLISYIYNASNKVGKVLAFLSTLLKRS